MVKSIHLLLTIFVHFFKKRILFLEKIRYTKIESEVSYFALSLCKFSWRMDVCNTRS